MRTSIIVFCWAWGLGVAAQTGGDERNYTDAKGHKQGTWVRTWAGSDQPRYQGQFKDDRPVGTFTYWSTTGVVESIVEHRADGRTTYAKHYHPNGQVMAEGRYVGQTKDSLWNIYDEQGRLASVERHEGGELHGEQLVYWPNGQVAERAVWHKGKPHGLYEQYFEDGTVKHRAEYVDGERNGKVIWFSDKGKKEIEGKSVGDQREGTWIMYNKDGSIREMHVYRAGTFTKGKRENGVFEDHYPDEQLRGTTTYRNGLREGPFKEYHDNGTWVLETIPADHVMGVPAYEQRVLKGQTVKLEGAYKADKMHGTVREYDERGRLLREVEYLDGVRQEKAGR